MHEALTRNVFLVKEHVGMFKAANNYDIFDPNTGDMILECREENLGIFAKLFRFTDYKRNTPFDIQIRTPSGEPVLRVKRGVTFFRSTVQVLDEKGEYVGGFKQKLLSIGGAFNVLGRDGETLCQLKGKWSGWEFAFVANSVELARVTKKWAGIGREFFTSADNYVLEIDGQVPPENPVRELILAAVMCIDMVLKER